jgi:hypothetical protein
MASVTQNACERVAHDVLSLKGLALGGLHHPATSAGLKRLFTDPVTLDVRETACAGTCKADCRSSPNCALCHACRSPAQTRILQQLQAEHHGELMWVRAERAAASSSVARACRTTSASDTALCCCAYRLAQLPARPPSPQAAGRVHGRRRRGACARGAGQAGGCAGGDVAGSKVPA